MKKDIFKKIIKIIKKYDCIVITRHISPDPDAIASQVALRDAIKLMYPEKQVFAIGAGVSKFKYLGTLDKVDVTTLKDVLLVVLDVPNFCRVDGIEGLEYKEILKIDHHPAEDIIGDVDWTDDTYSSTCEMITELFLNTNFVMDKSIAEDLFVGIAFDSDRFLLTNTSKRTFKLTYELLDKSNINFFPLYDNLYTRSIEEERFHAFMIENLEITENGFGYLYVSSDDLEVMNMEPSNVSNLVNEFYFIKELICWMFVVYDQKNDIYKANIRSRGPVINEVCMHHGGGGHKYASGCRNTNYKVMEELAQDLDKECMNYNNSENI